MDAGEEVPGGFVVSGSDGAELLEFCEEVLDQVACFIDVTIIGSGDFAICFGRNYNGLVFIGEQDDDPFVGVECLVGDQ